MYEEQRLISMGWPLEDALTLCHSLRKENELASFMKDVETVYKKATKKDGAYERICPVKS